ncbi:MAG: MFS transporter [Acidobacteria bacterium]|nr:MAG: MFS transporter [Acidobacteriota bacterium]
MAGESQQSSSLDRFLRLFTDVRAGEARTALLLSLNVFLILTAYYVLKPVREALILGQGSAELKSYLSAGQVLLLAIVVPLYGRLASRVVRRRLINIVTAIFVACLVGFFALAHVGVSLGVVFFLWVGIFNVMIVAQFWSFANDVYTSAEGERLFPIVAFGASLGAVLGAEIAAVLIQPLGVYQLMLVGAGLLVLEVMITNHIDTQEHARTESHLPHAETTAAKPAGTTEFRVETGEHKIAEEAEETPKSRGAFALVFKSRYLLLMAFMLMLNNWVNTTGEFILGSVVHDAAQEAVAAGQSGGLSVEDYIGEFYSKFFFVVNIAGLLIQLFLVSRIIKHLGIRIAVLIMPFISLGAYGVLAFYPILSAVRWAKTAENSTDYSLNNTVRNMLFLPCTREQKYSGKQVIDSFFVRAGDVLSAMLVFVGTTYFALHSSGFAKFVIVLIFVWLILAFLVGREYKRLVAGSTAGATSDGN